MRPYKDAVLDLWCGGRGAATTVADLAFGRWSGLGDAAFRTGRFALASWDEEVEG